MYVAVWSSGMVLASGARCVLTMRMSPLCVFMSNVMIFVSGARGPGPNSQKGPERGRKYFTASREHLIPRLALEAKICACGCLV